jgi:hypothetical protein
MRRTLICLLAAGSILVAACGGDDDGGSNDDSAAGSDGTVQGDGTVEGFCEQFRTYDQQFTEDPEASDEEVIAAIRSLDPPEEIRDDFETLIEGLDRLSAMDTSDPDSTAGLEEEMAQYTEASTNIQTFVDENCGDTSVDDSSNGSDATTGDTASDDATSETTAG